MPASQRILRVRRSDPVDDLPPYALISVTPIKGAKDVLDVKLLATEGENAFVAVVKSEKLPVLKSKSNTGGDAEWQAIVSRTLLHTSLSESKLEASVVEGLEIVCSVPNSETLIITWQRKKRTSSLVLGSITLNQTEEEQIDPFVWAGDAVQAADSVEDELDSLQAQLDRERESTTKLKAQLHSLVAAKEQHEQALFAKFVELINAKKLKIRDQQRLLADLRSSRNTKDEPTSSAPPPQAEAVTRKRTVADDSDDSSDGSDAFEDVAARAATSSPQPSAMDTDADVDKAPTPSPPRAVVRRVIGGARSKQPASRSTGRQPTPDSPKAAKAAPQKADGDAGGQSDDGAFDNPPPPKRRELPFQRRPAASKESSLDARASPAPATTQAVTRSQAHADEDAMEQDSNTEDEL